MSSSPTRKSTPPPGPGPRRTESGSRAAAKYFPNFQTDEGFTGAERIRAALLADPSPPRTDGWTLAEVADFCKSNRTDALLYAPVGGSPVCVGVVNKRGESAFVPITPGP